jgi:anti-sigma B factor antagonist
MPPRRFSRLWSREPRGILNRIPMLLQIAERNIEPDIAVMELTGKLAQGSESQQVEALMEEYARQGRLRVILDMSGVDHIDSAGIGMVALSSGRIKDAGGKLAVVAPEGRVLQLLKLTQLITIVTVCATVEEAEAAV